LSSSLGNDKKLPIELYTQFYPANTNMNLPRQQSIEISRFIILNSFLRRKGDNYFMMDKNAELLEGNGRRRFPHPMLGLAIGIIQTCAIHNIYHLFSIMDPALNRLFGFYGMQFYPIGPLVSYHGLRRPFYVCLIDVLERMYENHRDIWELVTDNGKVWPENLEYFKSICGPRQNVSNTDISIINC
jgi:N-acyl amino acid synthase of PEP-CTERM/exosortase system